MTVNGAGPEGRQWPATARKIVWRVLAFSVPVAWFVASPVAAHADGRLGEVSKPGSAISAVSVTASTTGDLSNARAETTAVAREPRSFTVAVTGDLLIHASIVRAARTGDGWDFTSMFSPVAPILRSADLAICHVETPMSPDNTNIASYPLFNVPNQLADAIAYAGYDTCSLASNHSLDTGVNGVVGTIEALDRVGVAHTGMARSPREQRRLNLLEVNGAWVAHLSYTYGLNTGRLRAQDAHLANIIDQEAILEEAGRARAAGADFIILSLHWGTEYRRAPDRYQADLGPRLLASPDVDLIIGHHAHVVQPVARIGGEYLVYGLGNFIASHAVRAGGGRPRGSQDGVILRFIVTEDPSDGRWRVTLAAYTPTRVDLNAYQIVNVIGSEKERKRSVYARSAAETAAALTSLGARVRAMPGPLYDAARWLSKLLDSYPGP